LTAVEYSNLPTGATFRGNLLSRLTLIERSQPEGAYIVDGVVFEQDSTRLITTSGLQVSVPAWSTPEETHHALSCVMDLAPLDPDSWTNFPPEMTPWAIWLTLHYDLASVERHLDINVPGLHLCEIHRHGQKARIATAVGTTKYDHTVLLTEQPSAIPVDLAFEVMRQRRGK
jgi:hypothetical protein